MTYSRSVVRATLIDGFHNTHIGFLISVERGLNVNFALPEFSYLGAHTPSGFAPPQQAVAETSPPVRRVKVESDEEPPTLVIEVD